MRTLIVIVTCFLLQACNDEKYNLPQFPLLTVLSPNNSLNLSINDWTLQATIEVIDDYKLSDFDIIARGFEVQDVQSKSIVLDTKQVTLDQGNTAKTERFTASTDGFELGTIYEIKAYIEVEVNKRIYSNTISFSTASIQLSSSYTKADLDVTLIGSISGFAEGDTIASFGHCWIRSEVALNKNTLDIDTTNALGILREYGGRRRQFEQLVPFEAGYYYYVVPYILYRNQAFYGTNVNEIFIGNSWSELAPYDECSTEYIPIGCLKDAVSFSIAGKGYIGTGRKEDDGFRLRTFWEYTPEGNIWERLEGAQFFPSLGRSNAVAFTIENTAYVGTGRVGTGTGTNTRQENDFYSFNPAEGWKRVDPFPYKVESAVAFSIGNKGYVGTGWACDDGAIPQFGNCPYVRDFYEFDPTRSSGEQWKKIRDYPVEVAEAVSFTIGEEAYVIGGVEALSYVQDSYKFNPARGTWTKIEQFLGAPRQKSIGFSLENKGYVGTGTNNDQVGLNSTFFDFYEFTPNGALGTWKRASDLGFNDRDSAAGFVIKHEEKVDKFYVHGGAYYANNQEVANDFWVYIPNK